MNTVNRTPFTVHFALYTLSFCFLAGCAATTTAYRIYPPPTPVETERVTRFERQISIAQAERLSRGIEVYDANYARGLGVDVEKMTRRIGAVSERPNLRYRVFILDEDEPNAVALADGRVYLTLGMVEYLRGKKEEWAAFVIGHELGHTNAQHLWKRYKEIQKKQLLSALVVGVTLGVAGRGESGAAAGAQEAARTARSIVDLLNAIDLSGYSQVQELEADQLAARYLMRAGYDPEEAVALLRDMKRFERGGPFLRTHPYFDRRLEDIERFLNEVVRPVRK